MSSFLKKIKHPVNNIKQVALCIDDYFGEHRYGYFFLKNGKDATWDDFYQDIETLKWREEFDIFNEDDIKGVPL